MAAAVIFMQWESHVGGQDAAAFFTADPLSFNSRQERLHRLVPGDSLWLVSRSPEDGQYYFVAALVIMALAHNPPESEKARLYGQYAVIADRAKSLNLGKQFPAEALLRAFTFDTDRPIKYGASIGQSLQTLRLLSEADERVLNVAVQAVVRNDGHSGEITCGLWTKCDAVYADYFLKNWTRRHEPLAFFLYDAPPASRPGAPVFIHSDKSLWLVARFLEGQYIAGHKLTVEKQERIIERERVWLRFRANTIDPPTREEFDKFWEGQNGVRALFMMDEVVALPQPVAFRTYGRALEWGYPMGVGYRYLSLGQSLLLLRIAALPAAMGELYLRSILNPAV
jgi:hypothetical protein